MLNNSSRPKKCVVWANLDELMQYFGGAFQTDHADVQGADQEHLTIGTETAATTMCRLGRPTYAGHQ
jgi:hypothetical protein